jgi:hypothetical protein
MDDFVLESDHYAYYNKGADFSVDIENEQNLNIPDTLYLYTFPNEIESKFPRPKHGSTGVSGNKKKLFLNLIILHLYFLILIFR